MEVNLTPSFWRLALIEKNGGADRLEKVSRTSIHFDPNSIYRAARGIFKEAGLSHLDQYDMRSHAITRFLSNPGVSDQMYSELVGHVGDAMKRRYSKQRMENKRTAMDALCVDKGRP
jgi:integrase